MQLSNATENIEEVGQSSTHDSGLFDFSNNDTERTQKNLQYLNDKDKQLAMLNRHTEIKQLFLCKSTLPLNAPVERLFSAGAVILPNKKAQLSLTNPRDAKACQKLLQFDVLTTLSLTILAYYLHSFSCCCARNLRNPAKFTENSNLWSSRSSKVIDLGVNRKPMYDFLLFTNSNFGRICYRFRNIDV